MSEDKRIEDMAQTMKAAAIEEMKAELEAAGYKFEMAVNRVRHDSCVVAPDGEWYFTYGDINDGLDPFSESEKDKQALVERAWKHHQRERRYEELQRSYAELEARLAKVERELEDLRGDGK
jgi:AAA+ ATPase superfamily predicted ATPase